MSDAESKVKAEKLEFASARSSMANEPIKYNFDEWFARLCSVSADYEVDVLRDAGMWLFDSWSKFYHDD